MELDSDAYIGLGSNLNNPAQQVRTALAELHQLPQTRLVRSSSLYVSAPLGPAGQNDYINAVAWLKTALEPLALLDRLQTLENRHLRVRQQHWGARTLDLDILLYAESSIENEHLSIPHPQMAQRLFVLRPLAEIAPNIKIPGQGDIQSLLKQCPNWALQKLAY